MKLFSNREMKGVITPMITPFKKNGELDKKAIKDLVNFLKTKVHGIFINGTYGSGPLMSIEERKQVLEHVMEEAGKEIQICVNVSSTNTKWSLDLGKHAEKMGAVSVASLPPYYYKHNADIIENYFNVLIKNINIPVYLYNNPSTVPFKITTSLLSKLISNGLEGIKDSSNDLLSFYEFINNFEDKGFKCIIGTEALMLPTVIMGAWGCISGMSNCLPELVVSLWENIFSEDIKKASSLQKKILNIRNIFKNYPTIPLIHRTLEERGINSGYPRAPFNNITDREWNDTKKQLKELGVQIA